VWLAIVTTNDELGELHPAVVRPGRCASQLSFGPLTVEEANAWLAERPSEDGNIAALGEGHDGATLAELYALAGDSVVAFAPDMGECENCGHSYAMHPDGGACSADDGCDQFESASDTEPDNDADDTAAVHG